MADDESKFWSPEIPSDDTQIWRYRDLPQFLSILEQESLWFNRADQFPDSFEGSFTKANVNTRKKRYNDTEIPDEALDNLSEAVKNFRRVAYLNCWHINTHESAAMWDLYLPADKGIAVRSTVGRLREAINQIDNDAVVEKDADDGESEKADKLMKIGKIRYIDYNSQLIPENNLYAPLFHKRKSFRYEREFRVAFSNINEMLDSLGYLEQEAELDTAFGHNVGIDVSKLIESVRVAPSAPDWFLEILKSVTGRYEVDIPIKRSDLDEDPVF